MAELKEYKCPCCGGAIEFNISIQKMKCPYCDTEFEMETLKGYDEDLSNDKEDEMNWETSAGSEWVEGEAENMNVFVCNSCGGEIVGDATTAATSCPYCDNPVVMSGRLSGALRPDYVIPFQLDKEAAKRGYINHLKGKHFLPKVFKDENHIDEIKGLYVPFWLFDTDVDANIRYRGTKVRHWSDSKYRYTQTSFFSVSRGGKIGFQKIPVDGSLKMDNDLMESIEPYNFSQAVDFQTAYLSGYFADKYDVTEEASIHRANERVKTSTDQAFRSTAIGYNTLTMEHADVRLKNGGSKYALYPVWLLNTTWKDKRYTFAMNGQTGKFVGDLPMDKGSFWKWWAIWTAIFGVISTLVSFVFFNS